MKSFFSGCLLISFCVFSGVFAQEAPAAPAQQRIIMVDTDKNESSAEGVQVFVESGSDIIAGSPQENLKAAYRTWEEKCDKWKKDLDRLNGKNLLIRSCGQAKPRTEKIQLVTYYTVESKGEYKIKVGCSE